MAHEFESGFFVEKGAWHGLGTVLDNPPTTAAAIAKAGLDWQVEEKPIYFDPDRKEIPSHKALVRSSDRSVLGVVSQGYEVLQNQDAFSWFDFLVHDGDVSLEAAGSLKKGKRIWVLAKINGQSVDISHEDPVIPYLLLSNAHDGTMAVWISFTPIRIVCANTLSYALSDRYEKLQNQQACRIRHQGNIREKLAIARASLDFARQKFVDAADEYRAMANKTINTVLLNEYIGKVLEVEDPKQHRAYNQIVSNFEAGRGNNGQNLWHAYNGVTEWLDYQRGRSPENRLNSAWFGSSATIRERSHIVALALV